MISVITSTYNRIDRLKKCIASVKSQSYQDYEHIVVDDKSTDGTREYIASLNDPKIVYIRRTKNFGNDTQPKNDGIKAATGQYIAFLDDDCEYRKDHLQALVKELEANSDMALVYGDRWVLFDDGTSPANIGIYSDFNQYAILVRNYIDISDILVRKEVLFDVGGFDEQYKKYVDWNLFVRLVKAGYTFKRVPIILTDYHIHDGMKSKKKLDERGFSQPAWNPQDCDIYVPYLREIKTPKVGIFSITYDRLEYTKTCFESMYKTAGYPFDHFIYDNSVNNDTYVWFSSWNPSKTWVGKSHITYNGKNVGISAASNYCIDQLKEYDIIVKVDNDCLFKSENWLSKMVDIWRANRKIALSCYIEGLRDNPGGAVRMRYGTIKNEILGMTRHLGGICLFVDAQAYKNFRWDDADYLHGEQDVQFSQHLLKNGYEMGYLENYYAEHYEGTDGQHARYPEYFERRKHEKTTRYQPE